jgi:hypothetical protein
MFRASREIAPMTRARFEHKTAATLGLGLAFILPIAAHAQPGPGLSSGSGAGTGTGYSSGVQNNRSGSVSGVGPGSAVGNRYSPLPRNPALYGPTGGLPSGPGGFSVPMGPGVSTTFPDDPSLFPGPLSPGDSSRTSTGALATVRPEQYELARALQKPEDRSLALQRTASAAIFSNQLQLAHKALLDAADSAVLVSDPVVRDLRLIAIITSLNNLSEAHLREGKVDFSLPDLGDTPTPSPGAPAAEPIERPGNDRQLLIRRAEHEWVRASKLAEQIGNPTYKSEMLYRVVDSQAYGSQTVVNEFPHDQPADKTSAEKPAKPANATKPGNALDASADRLLAGAAVIGKRIPRPVWRDRSLVSIAYAAAASRQFARGLEVARMIPQPEVRTDALVRIAETVARSGNDPETATATYREAAKAVASIPLEDPRAVLAGVLIDNLISVGRFEDARATIVLYPDNSRRLLALGAVAESQGMRGASKSAREWIARDVPALYRDYLNRRVISGVLIAIEQNRSRDLSNRDR